MALLLLPKKKAAALMFGAHYCGGREYLACEMCGGRVVDALAGTEFAFVFRYRGEFNLETAHLEKFAHMSCLRAEAAARFGRKK
jgi:hypothetical protein